MTAMPIELPIKRLRGEWQIPSHNFRSGDRGDEAFRHYREQIGSCQHTGDDQPVRYIQCDIAPELPACEDIVYKAQISYRHGDLKMTPAKELLQIKFLSRQRVPPPHDADHPVAKQDLGTN